MRRQYPDFEAPSRRNYVERTESEARQPPWPVAEFRISVNDHSRKRAPSGTSAGDAETGVLEFHRNSSGLPRVVEGCYARISVAAKYGQRRKVSYWLNSARAGGFFC
jgi:hypothetical protein